jgi:HSP20 family molecular chaperone IbpA
MSNTIPQVLSSIIESNLNSSFAEQLSDILRNTQNSPNSLWQPPFDLVETIDYVKIFVSLAGVEADSIDVDFYNNNVKVKGERKFPDIFYTDNENRLTTRRQEIIYGPFERQIMLPISVTRTESVNINFNNGILIITIDKNIESSNRFSMRIRPNE